MKIRLLQPVGDESGGAVLEVDEDRARRLERQGYAVRVGDAPVVIKKKAKGEWQRKAS